MFFLSFTHSPLIDIRTFSSAIFVRYFGIHIHIALQRALINKVAKLEID